MLDDLDGLFHLVDTGGGVGVGEVVGAVLFFHPASADAEEEAASGEELEVGGHLGEQGGVAVGLTEDAGAEFERGVRGGERRDGGEALQVRRLVGDPRRAGEDVIVHPDGIEVGLDAVQGMVKLIHEGGGAAAVQRAGGHVPTEFEVGHLRRDPLCLCNDPATHTS